MLVNNLTLENGLKVCFIPDKNSDSVTIHLKGLVGSNFERGSQIGSAHILEHLYTSSNYGNKLVSGGGKIVGVTSRDDVLFMVKVPKSGVIDGLDFLSKVFTKSEITKGDFTKLKNISLQEIKRILSNPEKFLGRISSSTSFPNGRMSKLNIGEEKYLNKLTIKELAEYRDNYYYPNNFVLVLSGNLSVSNTLPYVKKFFGEYKKGRKAEYLKHNLITDLVIKEYEFKALQQDLVKIDFYGFRVNDNKKYASLVISNILDSLLNKLIKERLGLSYVVRCVSSSYGSYGLFSIYFSCDRDNLVTILKEIKQSTSNFSSLISTRSIENSKTKVLSNLNFEMEKISVIAEFHSNLLLHGRKDQDYKYEIKNIQNCSLSNIRSVSQYIFSQKPKVTIIGDNIDTKDIENTLV
jgi:predicted Zn-dependent peptidase